jgi:hypothetical protein
MRSSPDGSGRPSACCCKRPVIRKFHSLRMDVLVRHRPVRGEWQPVLSIRPGDNDNDAMLEVEASRGEPSICQPTLPP